MFEAIEWYNKSVDQGNSNAQFNLAVCYEHGVGVEKNLQKAFELYTKSAEQGNQVSQHALARCYLHGEGVNQSIEKAFKWALSAAKQGCQDAKQMLCTKDMNNFWISQNWPESFHFLNLNSQISIMELFCCFVFCDKSDVFLPHEVQLELVKVLIYLWPQEHDLYFTKELTSSSINK